MSNVAPNPNSGVGNANIKPEGSLGHQTSLSNATSTGEEKVGFKAQVEGYAKKFAGQTFGNEKEVAQGEARLNGEDVVGNTSK